MLFRSIQFVCFLSFLTSGLIAQEQNVSGSIEKLGSLNRTPFIQLEYIMVDKAEWTGEIVASYRGGKAFSNTDKVYLQMKDMNVSIGDRLTVFKTMGAVKDPNDNFDRLGERIQVLSSLRVTAILPDLVEGVIYDSQEDATIGDKVAPLMQTQVEINPQEPVADVEGRVLGPAGINHLSGSFEMVFLDKGSSHGLRANDRLHIIRKGEGADAKMKKRLPDVSVAELIVIHASNKYSTAYVKSSVESFEAGARFRSAKSKEVYLDDKSASSLPDSTKGSPQPESNSGSLQN